MNNLQSLQHFADALAQEGFEPVQLLEQSQDRPYEVLLVFLVQEHHPEGGLQLELSFIPQMEEQLAGLSLLQFFVGITDKLSEDNLELQKAIISINRFCPLVGFGILAQPGMLYFRHVLMLPKNVEDGLPLIVQTTWLISYLMEVFGNALTQIAEEHASIADAFREHPFRHLLT